MSNDGIEYDEAASLFVEAMDSGVDPDAIAEAIDALVDWRQTLPAPFGEIAEAADGHAAKALVRAARKAAGRVREWFTDPARRAKAKAKRQARRAKRAAKRAARDED